MEIALVLDSSEEIEAEIGLKVSGRTFPGESLSESVPARLKAGKNHISHKLRLDAPRLWWPWDQGRPDLYELEVTVAAGGEVSDAVSEPFGIRELGWERNPGSPKREHPLASGACHKTGHPSS